MGRRMHGEAWMLVMVLAMTWVSMPMPSSAQTTERPGPCWEAVDACIKRHVNESATNPEFDSHSPNFNLRKLLCCPLIQQIARADVPCFCSIGPTLHHTPQGANLTSALIFCDAFDSLASFDTTCKGQGLTPSPTKAPRSTPASNRTRSPTRSPPGLTSSPPSKTPSASPPSLTPSPPTKTPLASPPRSTRSPPSKTPSASPPRSTRNPPSKTPSASPPSLTPSPPTKTPSASPPSLTPSPTQAPAMSPQDGSCWEKIGDCLTKNLAQRKTVPRFNPESKSFNQTEFFCCPLIQQAAKTDKPCFCTVATVIHEDPKNSTGILTVLNACSVSDSLASLDAMCSTGPTPPPTASAPAPAMPASGLAPNAEETSDVLPTPGKDSPPKSASTKNSMMGLLYGGLILLAYFL